ncbi:MAG: HAMP domain-containing histidine kinase [Chloroflexi bacterium]|nr:HAMP domain-containing histidine kinase [Chloroflexota bacterium]
MLDDRSTSEDTRVRQDTAPTANLTVAVLGMGMNGHSNGSERRFLADRRSMTRRQLMGELDRVSVERDGLQQLADEHAAQLAEVERIKHDFLLTASHELNTPLASICGYAQLLLRQLRDPAVDVAVLERWVAVIDRSGKTMTKLIDSLLDAARIEAGFFDAWPSPCTLDDCLATVLSRLGADERARVDLVLPHEPLAGEWERARIEQVLANCIGNALKYSPPSERVTVLVERRPGHLEVAVRDHGLGLPPEELPRLFQRFYRTPQALASGLPGSGLGLYICHSIVAAHGGRLWAESEGTGQGAVFRFTLPDRPPDDPTGRQTIRPRPAALRRRVQS